jgi:hypothetical protein
VEGLMAANSFTLACTAFKQDIPTESGLIYNAAAVYRILLQTKKLIAKDSALLYAPKKNPASGTAFLKDTVGSILGCYLSANTILLDVCWIFSPRYHEIKPLIEACGYGIVRPLLFGQFYSCGMVKADQLELRCWVLEPIPATQEGSP